MGGELGLDKREVLIQNTVCVIEYVVRGSRNEEAEEKYTTALLQSHMYADDLSKIPVEY